METYTVCYDKFCIGKYSVSFREDGNISVTGGLGKFENYILGMWNDGMVVTMKRYEESTGEMDFILLLPDGSEQLMTYREGGYVISSYRKAGEGRMAYLLAFNRGLEYKNFRGYDEYDEEEEMFLGVVSVGEKTLTYCGRNVWETKKDFERVIDEYMFS